MFIFVYSVPNKIHPIQRMFRKQTRIPWQTTFPSDSPVSSSCASKHLPLHYLLTNNLNGLCLLKEYCNECLSAFFKHTNLPIVGNVGAFMRQRILASLETKRILDKFNVDNLFSFDHAHRNFCYIKFHCGDFTQQWNIKNEYGKNCGHAVMVICAIFHWKYCKRYTNVLHICFPTISRSLFDASKPRDLLRSKQRLSDLRDKTLAVRQKREAVDMARDAKGKCLGSNPPLMMAVTNKIITFLVRNPNLNLDFVTGILVDLSGICFFWRAFQWELQTFQEELDEYEMGKAMIAKCSKLWSFRISQTSTTGGVYGGTKGRSH